jgi:ABC-2 type transport system permease protein
MKALFKKELKENMLKFIIETILLVGLAISLVPYGFRMIKSLAPLLNGLSLSGLGKEIYGILPKLSNLNFYIVSQWFGKNLLEFAILFAVINSVGVIAGEAERKTAIFLFTRPVSRARILFAKFVVAILITLVPIVLATYLLPPLSLSIPQKLDMALLNRFTVEALFATAAIVSLTVFFSVLVNDRVKCGIIVFAVLISTFFISRIPFLRWTSLVQLYMGQFALSLIISSSAIIVFLILSVVFLERKEF